MNSNLARQSEAAYQEAEWKYAEAYLKAEKDKQWLSDIQRQWQEKASEAILAMCPKHLKHTDKKLVHLKDVRNHKNQLVTLLKKKEKNKSGWDQTLSTEAQWLHDVVTASIKAIYSSGYNHRGDKLADLYSILFTIEHDLPCDNPILVKDERGMASHIFGVIPHGKGEAPHRKGERMNPHRQRRIGVSM
ncbi:hypothetical protein [Yersinia kristensenii]|uniref:hypothetical protein n=1 Tax=Yersinia kristensenii TaxID=28152 RepID=UPI001C60E22E|nr:hypothetical protein [Yersinia kristensenii]MBW5812511.1 hypothetical protein [Yersinia kristensenii]MBW5829812.1 hypothetical protein [Yersinia kristensenii]